MEGVQEANTAWEAVRGQMMLFTFIEKQFWEKDSTFNLPAVELLVSVCDIYV